MSTAHSKPGDESRRSFLAKAVYVAPLILSLKAEPSFASSGSGHEPARWANGNKHYENSGYSEPPGHSDNNDNPGNHFGQVKNSSTTSSGKGKGQGGH
jgi:hypothetical protein